MRSLEGIKANKRNFRDYLQNNAKNKISTCCGFKRTKFRSPPQLINHDPGLLFFN